MEWRLFPAFGEYVKTEVSSWASSRARTTSTCTATMNDRKHALAAALLLAALLASMPSRAALLLRQDFDDTEVFSPAS